MRFNIVSETSDGFGFAYRLQAEGEKVRMWIRSSQAKAVGDNMVPKVGDLEDMLVDAKTDDDIFVFDVSGNGLLADYLRSSGFAVLGGSMVADRLERDRSFGLKVMKECGIDTPKTFAFSDFAEATKFVEDNADERWVYKPSKILGDLSPSHVSYDAEDMIELLRNVESSISISDPQFELQQFVKGIAFSTELWFNNGQLIESMTNHTIERKELMNNDIGPSGGCTGNIVWFCGNCPICDICKRLAKFAERERYHGMLDLNVIVAKDGVYGLEFTPRFGYDASPTLFWTLANDPLGKLFSDAARGQLVEPDLDDGFGGGVRVTIPPWPSEKFDAEENVPIRGLGRDWQSKTFLYNVKENESGLCSAGAWGILLLFTGTGRTIDDCLVGPLSMCEKVRVKNKQYRTDMAEVLKKDFKTVEYRMSVGVE